MSFCLRSFNGLCRSLSAKATLASGTTQVILAGSQSRWSVLTCRSAHKQSEMSSRLHFPGWPAHLTDEHYQSLWSSGDPKWCLAYRQQDDRKLFRRTRWLKQGLGFPYPLPPTSLPHGWPPWKADVFLRLLWCCSARVLPSWQGVCERLPLSSFPPPPVLTPGKLKRLFFTALPCIWSVQLPEGTHWKPLRCGAPLIAGMPLGLCAHGHGSK